MLDVAPERDIMDLIRDLGKVSRETLAKYLVRHSSGLNVLGAPADTLNWRGVEPAAFGQVLDLLSKSHDIVVVDTAGLLHDVTVSALEKSSLILFVVATEFSCVKDSLRAIEALRVLSLPEERIHLIINDVSSVDGVRPHTIEDLLQRKAFSRIPFDKKVRHGSQVGLPAVVSDSSSPGVRRLVELARSVAGVRPQRRGVFSVLGRISSNGQRKPEPAIVAEESETQ